MHTFTYGRLTCTHILGSHEHIYKDTGSHAHIYKDIVGSHTHKHTHTPLALMSQLACTLAETTENKRVCLNKVKGETRLQRADL